MSITPRVLLTGATGFVGQHALRHLGASGAEVHALSRAGRTDAGTGAGAEWHAVDLHDRAAVSAVLARIRPTHLLHLAWYVEPADYLISAQNLQWVGTTLHLAEAFVRCGGRRIVAVGTSAEYAATSQPCHERRTAIAPTTLYAVCKHAVHEVLQEWSDQIEGSTLAWGRVFFLYGPGEHTDRLIPQLIRASVARTPFALRYPDQVRDYLHVDDAARALVALLDSAVEGPVNIASGEGVRLADVAAQVGECAGWRIPLEGGAADLDDKPWIVADAARLRGEIGFAPRYSLERGIHETVEWWKRRTDTVLT